MSFVTRIAPTPSGFLHKGNAFNFLLIQSLAKRYNAKILLRIDDADALRCKDEYLEDIFASLEWLGIDWDIGPTSIDDFKRNWSQSLRLKDYHQTLEKLKEKELLFACACSRKALAEYDLYPQTCLDKNIAFDAEDVAWRIKTGNNSVSFNDKILGSIYTNFNTRAGWGIVRRRDGLPAYHISSLTDDVLFGVNMIVRGADLVESTSIQLFIANALGLDDFRKNTFYHHPLLKKADGEKLSKSKDDVSLKQMRMQNISVHSIINEFNVWASKFL